MSDEKQTSAFEDLPAITTLSILGYVTSIDWLNFRVVSRRCYEAVHDTANVWHAASPPAERDRAPADAFLNGAIGDDASTSIRSDSNARTIGGGTSDSLWRLALARDYEFVDGGRDGNPSDDECLTSIHSPALLDAIAGNADDDHEPFLSTENAFAAPNAFVSWKHWRKVQLRFGGIPGTISGPYFLRACRMWKMIEDWCDRNGVLGRNIRSSLKPGWPCFPRDSNPSVSAFRAVYAFYAGQDERAFGRYVTGLFGGFQAYDVISISRWMIPSCSGDPSLVVISQSAMKTISMETLTGQLYSTSRCNPIDVADGNDSLLRWFEEHASRLHRDYLAIGILHPDDVDDRNDNANSICSLLKYPTVYDANNCSRTVTRGLEIVASSIFVEEMGMFVYSIRMRLLTPDDGDEYMTPEARGYDTCQLVSRHWRITKLQEDGGSPVIEDVRGDGVIGYFPILCDGSYVPIFGNMQSRGRARGARGAFSYQSCTEAPGSIEGSLQFRPMWRDDRPDGDIFDARVDPFPLTYPQFLY
jgi:hypothetical protein